MQINIFNFNIHQKKNISILTLILHTRYYLMNLRLLNLFYKRGTLLTTL